MKTLRSILVFLIVGAAAVIALTIYVNLPSTETNRVSIVPTETASGSSSPPQPVEARDNLPPDTSSLRPLPDTDPTLSPPGRMPIVPAPDTTELVGPDHGRAPSRPTASAGGLTLLIPVVGVQPGDLVDTYTAARSSGRSHDAIDIIAPRGTPVVAVADGAVMQLFLSDQGGITLYQLDPDQRTIYYYAHLDRYAPGIVDGVMLQRGDTLGYVGDTGNAGAGNYHLHFEISTTEDPDQYWGGTPTNPYPLLKPGGR